MELRSILVTFASVNIANVVSGECRRIPVAPWGRGGCGAARTPWLPKQENRNRYLNNQDNEKGTTDYDIFPCSRQEHLSRGYRLLPCGIPKAETMTQQCLEKTPATQIAKHAERQREHTRQNLQDAEKPVRQRLGEDK